MERVALAAAYKRLEIEWVDHDPADRSLEENLALGDGFPRLAGWIRRVDARPRA